MYNLLSAPFAVQVTRELARSAMPQAPVVRRRPRRLRPRRAAGRRGRRS